jgi:hypothetical protein
VPIEGRPLDREKLRAILDADGCSVLGSDMRWQVDIVEKKEFEFVASYKFQHFVSRLR